MPPIARVYHISIIIDLLLAVLENITVGYLGYRAYTREQETILQMINHVRGTLMYYTIGLPRAAPAEGNSKGKAGKCPRSTRGCGGVARNSEDDDDDDDDDDETESGAPAARRRAATTMCSVYGKEV